MSVKLTESQQSVVNDRGGRLLVSAAAGSGKTKVLVERLFCRVLGEERADMDDFLIITYTRAAAAELRERIAQELSGRMADLPNDRHLQRQLMLVYQADIKTIDAFCTALLRENIHLMDFGGERGLTADFRVLDDNEATLLRRRVLPRVLEGFYTDMTPDRIQLADAFGFGRDDSRLEELVLELYNKVQSHAYPERWLEEQRAAWASLPPDGGETVCGRELLSSLTRRAAHWAAMLRAGLGEMAAVIILLAFIAARLPLLLLIPGVVLCILWLTITGNQIPVFICAVCIAMNRILHIWKKLTVFLICFSRVVCFIHIFVNLILGIGLMCFFLLWFL